jgi:hypothetical protein
MTYLDVFDLFPLILNQNREKKTSAAFTKRANTKVSRGSSLSTDYKNLWNVDKYVDFGEIW